MTPKIQLFIAKYCIHFNATQAAKDAGYSEKTAYSIGCELLKKPEVRLAIQTYIDETLDNDKMTLKREIIDKLRHIAFKDDEATEHGKIKALELLGKYMTMFSDKKTLEIKNDKDNPIKMVSIEEIMKD